MQFLEIDSDLQADILSAAARHNRTPESLVQEVLREFLDVDQAAAAGLAEADAAWADFERTGEGVTLEEAAEWFASWGTPNPKPVPLCRKL